MADFLDRVLYLMKQKGIRKSALLEDLGLSKNSFINWRNRGNVPSGETIKKIADYLGVSVNYLLGTEDGEQMVTMEEFKVALFGGNGEVTPEMWAEVKQFAEFVRKKHENNQ